MNVPEQIDAYIHGQPEPKRADMLYLHEMILKLNPGCRLWFLDGKNSENKVVSNPNIGYGFCSLYYTNGKTKEFYRIGLSANTGGISVYILGIEDKEYLRQTFGKALGKAKVSGYCIKFKTVKDIDPDVLKSAIQFGFTLTF